MYIITMYWTNNIAFQFIVCENVGNILCSKHYEWIMRCKRLNKLYQFVIHGNIIMDFLSEDNLFINAGRLDACLNSLNEILYEIHRAERCFA